jgi:hypothetical protein
MTALVASVKHCCIKRSAGPPELVHLLALKPRSRSKMPGLLRLSKVPEGVGFQKSPVPLAWVTDTACRVPEVGRTRDLGERGDPRDQNDRAPCRCACSI